MRGRQSTTRTTHRREDDRKTRQKYSVCYDLRCCAIRELACTTSAGAVNDRNMREFPNPNAASGKQYFCTMRSRNAKTDSPELRTRDAVPSLGNRSSSMLLYPRDLLFQCTRPHPSSTYNRRRCWILLTATRASKVLTSRWLPRNKAQSKPKNFSSSCVRPCAHLPIQERQRQNLHWTSPGAPFRASL